LVPTPHTLFAQSVPTAHFKRFAQRMQLFDPPQSVSVSFWFFTVSGQLGAWHVHGGAGQLLFTPQTPL
jgi:hypothetical protein